MSKKTMNPENVAGPFYITNECISCSACWEIVPDFIESHPIDTYAYFYNQPRKKEDIKSCLMALEICPVACIHFKDKGSTINPT